MLSLIILNCSKIIGRFSTRRIRSNNCSSTSRVARLSTVLKIEKKTNQLRQIRKEEEEEEREEKEDFSASFTRLSLLRIFKVGRDGWPMPSGKRRSYRASNFCERPKITGRRVPDVAENRNFENRSPFVSAALLAVCLCLKIPFEGRKKNDDTRGICYGRDTF